VIVAYQRSEAAGITDQDVVDLAKEAQEFVTRRIAPAWGVDAQVIALPLGAPLEPLVCAISLLDHETIPGALGDHRITDNPAARPFGIVGVKDAAGVAGGWRRTAMHELELLVDPRCNRSIQIGRYLFALEICDAVEDDSDEGSNFVLESYFIPGSAGPWDADGHLPGPISEDGEIVPLTPGGYMSRLDLLDLRTGWMQVNARGQRLTPKAHTRTGLRHADHARRLELAAGRGEDWAK
jgi:hypothetical protein